MNRKKFIHVSALGLLSQSISGAVPLFSTFNSLNKTNKILHIPVVIIGTGYGSAVAALRLAEKGIPVVMIEEGVDWEQYRKENPKFKFPEMTFPSNHSTWLRNTSIAPIPLGNLGVKFKKFTGVLERRDFSHIKVYLGKGVGGGSLVNGGMTVTPDPKYFHETFQKVGVEIDIKALYTKYFPKANEMLGMSQIPEDLYQSEWYKFSRIGIEEGKKAGFTPVEVPNLYDFEHLRKEIKFGTERSATSMEVIYGNNYGKKDLTKSYLKKAKSTGLVEILAMHRVEHICKSVGSTYKIHLSAIDTQGNTIDTKDIVAKHIFLGAGSLGTTEILLRSEKINALAIPKSVGQYWGNNGNTMASRYTWMVVGHESRGRHQSTMPVRGLSNWNDPDHRFFAEIAPMPIFGSHTANYLIVSEVKKYGKLALKENGQLDILWNEENNAHMRTNAAYFLKKMNLHGSTGAQGHTYQNNTVLFPRDGIDETICYHPLGGCIYGVSTEENGQLKGCPNIYIVDGSLIPGTLGVNPYVSITAMAEMIMDKILPTISV